MGQEPQAIRAGQAINDIQKTLSSRIIQMPESMGDPLLRQLDCQEPFQPTGRIPPGILPSRRGLGFNGGGSSSCEGQHIDGYTGRWSVEEAIRYDKFATQSFSWRYIEEPSLRRLIGPVISSRTVALDLGCGGGRIISLLIELGVTEESVYGLDNDPTLLNLARQRFPRATILSGELDNVPYEGVPIGLDLITAHLVLQYLSIDSLSTCLAEAYRLLKPGGLLAVGIPHPIRAAQQSGTCYFARQHHRVRAPWGGMTTTSGLTISDYFNCAIDSSFSIVSVHEPEITDDGSGHDDVASYSPGPTRLMLLLRATLLHV
jgi:trans-aconitate methyltransferase